MLQTPSYRREKKLRASVTPDIDVRLVFTISSAIFKSFPYHKSRHSFSKTEEELKSHLRKKEKKKRVALLLSKAIILSVNVSVFSHVNLTQQYSHTL